MLGTLIDTSRWWTRQHRHKAAIVTESSQVSYGELDEWVVRLSQWLVNNGLDVGDRVVVLGSNSLEWCVLSQAVARSGGVLAPVNFRSTAHEVQYMCERYEPKMVFADCGRIDVAREALLNMNAVNLLGLYDHVNEFRHQSPSEASLGMLPEVKPDDHLVIIPTSGSTGRPKGVVYSHRTLVEYILEFALTEPQVVADAKILLFAPLSTSAGYNLLSKFLACGGTVFIHEAFDAEKALDCILDERISVLMGVPLFFEAMAACSRFKKADLSHLKLALCGGAAVSRQLLDSYQSKGTLLRQLYGQTEVGGQATYNTVEYAQSNPEKCGYGLPFKRVAVIDGDGAFCPPNTVGQIVVKGPGVMVEYWRDAKATQQTLIEGWVRTGDLGTIDDHGLLQMVDRLKDIIISGGINISAAEIERVIALYPGVREVAVIAASDDRFGETPLAIIYGADDVVIDGLITYCNKELSSFKVPRYVALEAEPLPRLPTGKISKPMLRDKYKNAHNQLKKIR